ncbi:Hypothetical predicted protein [Mytilus galloprovincialis]|uniref:Uncharacterized protein n=1 Tax=Mytilus galloprovincialis TaxID=29158 RepID=A0A8B6GHE2_MYTGA|nr:Hypothetical predicted protein [Mytilus galloprovincialis]
MTSQNIWNIGGCPKLNAETVFIVGYFSKAETVWTYAGISVKAEQCLIGMLDISVELHEIRLN